MEWFMYEQWTYTDGWDSAANLSQRVPSKLTHDLYIDNTKVSLNNYQNLYTEITI